MENSAEASADVFPLNVIISYFFVKCNKSIGKIFKRIFRIQYSKCVIIDMPAKPQKSRRTLSAAEKRGYYEQFQQ